MELKMIELKDIVTNPLQPRQEFDREKLQELANSIKEGELLQPIVVRKYNGKWEIVAGERRFKAFQILKEPKIPSIIRDIKDDTDALEKSLIENLQRDDLTSVERENALNDLWKSKRYKTHNDLAKRLGISDASITSILAAKNIREDIKTTVSTRAIHDTDGLLKEPRKKLLEMHEKGKVQQSELRDITRKVKEFPEPEQQLEILEDFEEQEEQSKGIFDDIIQKKKEMMEGKREPEHYFEDDPDKIRFETFQIQCNVFLMMTPSNLKIYKNKKYQEQAIQLLKDTQEHIHKLLITIGETEVIE